MTLFIQEKYILFSFVSFKIITNINFYIHLSRGKRKINNRLEVLKF